MGSLSSAETGPDRSELPDTATLASGEEACRGTLAAGPVFLPSEVLADRFRVVRLLGRGGMGEVYEVEDLELGDRVAVKTLRPGLAVGDRALALFRSEIQLARRVTHPNVCRIFDVFRHTRTADGRNESVVFLTMELLAGDTLSARLRRDGPLPLIITSHPAESQHLREHANLREWRAQFVRNTRDELALHARELTLAMKLQERDDHEPGTERDEAKHEL